MSRAPNGNKHLRGHQDGDQPTHAAHMEVLKLVKASGVNESKGWVVNELDHPDQAR